MKKTIVFTTILSILMLMFTGCKNDNLEGEAVIKNFLTAYYTIDKSAYDYYNKMTKGATESELSENNVLYETNTNKFQQYLTDKSYQAFYTSRLSYTRIRNSFQNNNFQKINSLKISKFNEDKTTISYKYNMQLEETNQDTKKTTLAKESRTLSVTKENGSWKIVDIISMN